jgi:hypothetical protein
MIEEMFHRSEASEHESEDAENKPQETSEKQKGVAILEKQDHSDPFPPFMSM